MCLADRTGRNTMNRRDLIINFANRRAPVETPDLPYRASRFSNGALLTHENKQVKFYDDLIHGKQVVVNFMYASCRSRCGTSPASAGRPS